MNKQNNMKGRQRGRAAGKPRSQGGRNSNYDGGGNNNRIRGNSQQLLDKYLVMARDAAAAGDRGLAENYFQHADHYYRVVNARIEQQGQGGRRSQHEDGGGHNQKHSQGNGHSSAQSTSSAGSSADASYSSQAAGQTAQSQSAQPQSSSSEKQVAGADIGLPSGIFGQMPSVGADKGQGSQEGDETSRTRAPARRRRSRNDKPPTGANVNE
ncbi:MAG: hypothetical protein CMG46_11850 [Candidatus Marinimicrobia bacterium]|nr:hypothetical protein [Candidatus Neomarinimicrobiota bacterium]